MRKTLRITKREKELREMERRSNEGVPGARGKSVKFALIITEHNPHNPRKKPIRGKVLYSKEHAERICKQRNTASYAYAMTVVA
ncbi:hypothetical protein M0R72_05700 [Candidatus Pacearchaeota archaeon]|jgi:hypothetical protein|nr:hypothetical protein [Candidatus Pacearchaeota archaeon]